LRQQDLPRFVARGVGQRRALRADDGVAAQNRQLAAVRRVRKLASLSDELGLPLLRARLVGDFL